MCPSGVPAAPEAGVGGGGERRKLLGGGTSAAVHGPRAAETVQGENLRGQSGSAPGLSSVSDRFVLLSGTDPG